jgi:hypothetical protein
VDVKLAGDQSEIEDGENGKKNNIPKSIRLRASVLVNVRPTPGIQVSASTLFTPCQQLCLNKRQWRCIFYASKTTRENIDKSTHTLSQLNGNIVFQHPNAT